MKSSMLWGLVGLNAVLLIIFVGQFTRDNSAKAQAQFRRPSDYVMIPGEVQGGATELVYVVDTTNGVLGAVAYDDTGKTLQMMPSINLISVFSQQPGPGRGPQR
ncbi:MAG: hypothetical protein M3O30_03750 [Planctomycetota bacterium]|nr:hypothetical protein [Planctomycetota bacterium]